MEKCGGPKDQNQEERKIRKRSGQNWDRKDLEKKDQESKDQDTKTIRTKRIKKT